MQMQVFLWQVASNCEKIYPRVTVLYRPEDLTFEINLTGVSTGRIQCNEVSLVTKNYLELAVTSLIKVYFSNHYNFYGYGRGVLLRCTVN